MPPLVIMGAIAAAGAVGGAALTSRAANKAAKGQEDAGRQAQRFNEQVYSEQKQRMAPFEAMGTEAMKRYGQYVQQPFSQRLASLGQPYNPATAAGGQYALGPQPASQPASQPVQQAPIGGTATGPMPGGGGGFGMGGGRGVPMIAPDGRTRMVPPHMVNEALANGGKMAQ